MLKIMRRGFLLVTALMLLAAGSFLNATRSAHAVTCTLNCNATEKKDVTAWGASAYITWTNPNLKGGSLSFHRVSTVLLSAHKFVEWGPAQTSSGFQVLLAWDDGSGVQNEPFSGISAATHRYSHQYDTNTGKYWFYVDGANYSNKSANFSSGDLAGGGGEAGDGVEAFNSTYLYDLRYLQRNPDGTFVFVSWNGHVNYHDDPPYYNTNGSDSNSFYDKP